MDHTGTHTPYQPSNSEQLEVNAKLFIVIRKGNISAQEKVEKIKKLFGKNPQPDINAQDGNDKWNTALHLAIERNELEVVNCLLRQGAGTAIENGDGKTALKLAEECKYALIIEALKSCISQVEWLHSETDRLASHKPQPVAANPNVFHSNSHAAATVPSGSSGYSEKYYIGRTFNRNIFIRQDILSDKKEGKFVDLLASTEQEFKQLCQQNPNSNVHWLVEDASGKMLWQQSKGNIKTLREYIDVQKSQSFAHSDVDKLLDQAKHQRFIIIADTAGMGKTTVLTHVSKRIMKKSPAHWLVRIDLNDYTGLLKAQKGKEMDKEKVLEFISKEVLKLESDLEKELFKKSFEGSEINKVVVMVDGFDEISPNYKETVIDMLQVLKLTTSLEQLWVTTRPHLRAELEDNLQQLSYTLQPFSEVEQVEFLNKLWSEPLDSKATDDD